MSHPLIKSIIVQAQHALSERNMGLAKVHLQQGLSYAEKFKLADDKIYMLGTLAGIECQDGNFDIAEKYILDALTVKGANAEAYLSVKCDLVDLLLCRGDLESACKLLTNVAEELAEKFPEPEFAPPIIEAIYGVLTNLTDRLNFLARQK